MIADSPQQMILGHSPFRRNIAEHRRLFVIRPAHPHFLTRTNSHSLYLSLLRNAIFSSAPCMLMKWYKNQSWWCGRPVQPLGKTSRLGARVAAPPLALSPNGCKGRKSRIARRGKPRGGGWTMEEVKRLRANGKHTKPALVVCMRKFLVILNAMLHNSTHWQTPALISPTSRSFSPPGRGF